MEAARSYLLNNQVADNYQKIFVALDPDLAASDYFSQYSEIYSQWLPKMQLLLLMIAVGGIGTLVCLVLFTLQAGRNGKTKKSAFTFFDQWYTEIAAAAAILIVMGAVGIVVVCIELSYGGVHYIQNFDGNYIYSGSYGNEADTWRSLVAASGILAGFLITLIPYCSLVRRIKARNVWKQSFCTASATGSCLPEEPSMKADRSRSERSLCSAFSAACRSFSAAASECSAYSLPW